MSFNPANLTRLGPLFDDLPAYYVYTTSDNLADVVGDGSTPNGYFPVTINVRRGDHFRVVAGDGEAVVVCTQTLFTSVAILFQVRETL